MTLMDTHIWIWWEFKPELIPPGIRSALDAAEFNKELSVSVVSVWEIATKVALGKLVFPCPVREWVENTTAGGLVTILPLAPDVALASAELPEPFHRDPADRLIVAQARRRRATLVTADRKILAYPHVKTAPWE